MSQREYKFRLSNNSELITLDLIPASETPALFEVMKTVKKKVFFDHEYRGQLLSAQTNDTRNLEIYINNYPVNHQFYGGHGTIDFRDSVYGDEVFRESFGLCQIKLRFRNSSSRLVLVSEYFQVMVRPGPEIFNASHMGQYVAIHNRSLLYGTKLDYTRQAFSDFNGGYSLEDKVRILKRTAALMERSWPAIRIHPRQKEDISGRGPSGLCSQASIRYLAAHPEFLHKSMSSQGIRIGNSFYIPTLPQAPAQAFSTDVYENQSILAFLKLLFEEVQTMSTDINQAQRQLPILPEENEGYVSSSYFMYSSASLAMENTLKELEGLSELFSSLYASYKNSIPAGEIALLKAPRPTPGFLQIPAYRQVFETMNQYFAVAGVSVRDMRFMQTFLQITTLYEVYVLTKLNRLMESMGFTLVSSRQRTYTFEHEALYENTRINNSFEYVRDDLTVRLFYQPVIYDQGKADEQMLGLFRSTSLSFPKSWDQPTRGNYYSPDYVLKISKKGHAGSRYVLADAKYTTYRNTRDFKVIPLVWKYLFSCTCSNPEDRITGLYIFHGRKGEGSAKNLVHSVYDLMKTPQDAPVQTEIISLYEAENVEEEKQMEAMSEILERQLCFD